MKTNNPTAVAGSFRDPSGFVFRRDGEILRQVNQQYAGEYEHLMASGLYDALVEDNLLIPHEEIGLENALSDEAYKILRPEQIPFISYPYEWCFSQLKDAALRTLEIQTRALDFGMSLKDCSAYNVQFRHGRPVFVDTLSFETYQEGKPWVAYRQFCQHFLAPLALMSHRDIRLSQLLRTQLDGIPLDLASTLLPARSRLSFSLLSHIHLHAKAQQRFAGESISQRSGQVSRIAFLGLVDSLRSAVEKLRWTPTGTEWEDYYAILNYSSAELEIKRRIVAEMLDLQPASRMVWDLGANTGLFSRIASDRGIPTISFDLDHAAVEKNYLESVERGETDILPLVLDLTNPSPGLGWENRERAALVERGPADAVLALALVHHLAIGNNLPLDRIAGFLSRICTSLIIEFVPKEDPQVQRLLSSRKDIFDRYTEDEFERQFGLFFSLRRAESIAGTGRRLYLFTREQAGQDSASRELDRGRQT